MHPDTDLKIIVWTIKMYARAARMSKLFAAYDANIDLHYIELSI